jgi:hypothetical protein
MINTIDVLTLIGWFSLALSWIVPFIMKHNNKENTSRYFWGAALAAFSVGIFISTLICVVGKVIVF